LIIIQRERAGKMEEIGTICYFEAAHRQLGDQGKCGRLHGHNWKVEVNIAGRQNKLGYIVDFKDIKEFVDSFDHCVILHIEDPLGKVLKDNKQKVVDLMENPTCENIADVIADWIFHSILNQPDGAVVVKVWENHKSWAEAKR
jgi:6-pyruvoyltetrahydropterin/6-carboxytetrahydropterin synthase